MNRKLDEVGKRIEDRRAERRRRDGEIRSFLFKKCEEETMGGEEKEQNRKKRGEEDGR